MCIVGIVQCVQSTVVQLVVVIIKHTEYLTINNNSLLNNKGFSNISSQEKEKNLEKVMVQVVYRLLYITSLSSRCYVDEVDIHIVAPH